MATFKYGDDELDKLCTEKAKTRIMNETDPDQREQLRRKHKKVLKWQNEEKKLSECDGRTTRSGKAKALAGEAPSVVCDLNLGKNGTYTVDTKFEASLEQLTTEVGREVRKNTCKQDGYNCMPIALATKCDVNPFVGQKPEDIRAASAEAIQMLVGSGVYGRNRLVKDVLVTNKDEKKPWEQIIRETVGPKWLGRMELDALARVHKTEIMTAQKTGKGTFSVLKFGEFDTCGLKVTSAQEIADFKGPILLNKGNRHWEALAPVQRAAAVADATSVGKKRKRNNEEYPALLPARRG